VTKNFFSQKLEHFKLKKGDRQKNGPFSIGENGPKAKKAYPKTSLDKLI